MLSKDEEDVLREVCEGTSEQLESIHCNFWGEHIIPVLLRMIVKERNENKILKIKIKYLHNMR